MQSSNDDHFDPKSQLQNLSSEDALEYALNFIDHNCHESDASYFAEVLGAGDTSLEITYNHALLGSAVAQLAYGVAKLKGSLTKKSPSEGLFWLMRSFNNGHGKAALVLAGAYLEGQHVIKDVKKAYRYATFAADRNLPEGQYTLANLLIGENEIPEDQERAIALLQKSAKNGYQPALEMLSNNDIPLK